ncbi:MAG: hypothetical protein ACI9LI_000981 [Saprospiraceae bacterium]|jgi:hypothetical protein
MARTDYSFDYYKLSVDYITFNFQEVSLYHPNIIELIEYLSKLGFNSIQTFRTKIKKENKHLKVCKTNSFKAYFIEDYHTRISISFSGVNANQFYQLIRNQLIDWKLFSPNTVSRFDLAYDREILAEDKPLADKFLDHCKLKLNPPYDRTSQTITENNISTLYIGHRKSDNYFRIYKKNNYFRFEHEIRSRRIQSYTALLLYNQNNLKEFESQLAQYSLKSWANRLPLDFSYMDWLAVALRPMRTQKFQVTLRSDYLNPTVFLEFEERKDFLTFLQFLNYCNNLKYESDSLGSTYYRKIVFKLQDFLAYKNENKNHYRISKIKDFFLGLKNNACLTLIGNEEIRLLSIPEIKLKKVATYWTCHAWIAEEFFDYSHPFLYPDFLNTKASKHEVEVQLRFIQVFASKGIKKTFYIKEFLEHFPSALNGKKKSQIKKYFIRLVEIFRETNLIQSNYKIISRGQEIETNELNSKKISEGFIIYENIN